MGGLKIATNGVRINSSQTHHKLNNRTKAILRPDNKTNYGERINSSSSDIQSCPNILPHSLCSNLNRCELEVPGNECKSDRTGSQCCAAHFSTITAGMSVQNSSQFFPSLPGIVESSTTKFFPLLLSSRRVFVKSCRGSSSSDSQLW